MRVYKHFPYTGSEQRWTVPTGVTSATFECWGAAGGMPSGLAFEGKKRQVMGGSGDRNSAFFNDPNHEAELGKSFANNAGYAAGLKNVSEGDVYYVYVGGNGGPGHSTIRLNDNGGYTLNFRGGAAGWNGGGAGGEGAHIYQNLYNSASDKVHYERSTMPNSAKVNQLWYDTTNRLVKQCNTTYTAGNGTAAKWTKVTHSHAHAAGPSGGGGGGATDIRKGGSDIGNRILIAGGSGGAGGSVTRIGPAAWTYERVPTTPAPPFGTDDVSTGATGPDDTWATSINYLHGGWGGGGLGGATGPQPTPATTPDGGYATVGGAGGPGTDRHKDGNPVTTAQGSGGGGGHNDSGGARGAGGAGGTDGSKGQGGTGAHGTGNYDDWCAGGGGGGGGYFGGGGGGQGFKDVGDDTHTRGGGGGGGSNYADPSFTAFLLTGAAQPPFAKGNSGTGANGRGGFARISYDLPPTVQWTSAPAAFVPTSSFTVGFKYAPAEVGGPGIAYYITGSATDPNATFPTSQSTHMVNDETLTDFTATFTSPANGVQNAYFVQVVDKDGDASAWLKQKVTGLSAVGTQSITSPAAGSSFSNSVTVNWSVGGQTPQVAYRLGLSGVQATGKGAGTATDQHTGWRRGGTRVNLAPDPRFAHTASWSLPTGASMAAAQTTFPGVGGLNAKVTWATDPVDDGSAALTSVKFDNLVPGRTYRNHLKVASTRNNDPRPIRVEAWDNSGFLTGKTVSTALLAAGTYVTVDLEFTPHTQGVYFKVLPSASTPGDGGLIYREDFEGGLNGFTALSPFTATADGTNTYQGDTALKVTGAGPGRAATKDITFMLSGAGEYICMGYGLSPVGEDHGPVIRILAGGGGTTEHGGAQALGQAVVDGAFHFMRFPFYWDGVGTVSIQVDGAATTSNSTWYDYIGIWSADTTGAASQRSFGSTDGSQHGMYLTDWLIELKYEEDNAGYGTYFDGGHANGNPGTASWKGTADASESYLTGTDIVTGALAYTGPPLSGATLYLDTLNRSQTTLGTDYIRASESISPNPTAPSTPTVTLTQDDDNGWITLQIDAADGAATYKTTSIDIFRNGTRIVTGLVPDQTTRLATYRDIPATDEVCTYTVRALASSGGWADQTSGTVF